MFKMGCCSCNYAQRTSEAFSFYGRKISNNPIACIFIAGLLNILLAINIRWLTVSDNYRQLNTNSNSDYNIFLNKIRYYFPNLGKTDTYDWQLLGDTGYGSFIMKSNDDIMTNRNRETVLEIHNRIVGIRVRNQNGEYGFNDICMLNGEQCYITGSFYLGDTFHQNVAVSNISYPYLMDIEGTSHLLSDVFGGVKVEDEHFKSAYSVKFTYHLRQDIDPAISKAWEEKFISTIGMHTYNVTLFYDASHMKDTALSPLYLIDPRVFVIMLGVFCVVAFFAGLGGNCISQHGNLALASVLSGCLSVLSALGVCSVIGVGYVNMSTIVPLLLLGLSSTLGFIFLSGVNNAPIKASPEEKVTHGIKTTGAPTIIAMATMFSASIVCGLVTDLPVLKSICWFTGSGVVLLFINHMTFFMACVVFDERRVASKRHWCACHSVYSQNEMISAGYRNNFIVVCCSGEPAESKDERRSFADNVLSLILPRFLLLKPVKVIVVLIYISCLAFAIWGCTTLKVDFRGQNVFKYDSSVYKYATALREQFDNRILISLNLDENIDFSKYKNFQEFQSLVSAVRDSNYIDNSFEINWLTAFYKSRALANTSEVEFIQGLKRFLNTNPQYKNDIYFNHNKSRVLFSRMYVLSENVHSTEDQSEMLKSLKDITEKSSMDIFAFSPVFTYIEPLVNIWGKAAMSLLITFGLCVIITILGIPNISAVFFIAISVVSSMIGIVGFMSFWDEPLNQFTVLYLTFSIGLCHVFSSFVCFVFLNSASFDRCAKASETLIVVSGTIFISCILFIVAFVALLFADINIITTLFKIILLSMIIIVFHSIILLPIVMSLIGPNAPYSFNSTHDTSKSPLFPNKSSMTWSVAGINALDTPFSPMKLSKALPKGAVKEYENRL